MIGIIELVSWSGLNVSSGVWREFSEGEKRKVLMADLSPNERVVVSCDFQ